MGRSTPADEETPRRSRWGPAFEPQLRVKLRAHQWRRCVDEHSVGTECSASAVLASLAVSSTVYSCDAGGLSGGSPPERSRELLRQRLGVRSRLSRGPKIVHSNRGPRERSSGLFRPRVAVQPWLPSRRCRLQQDRFAAECVPESLRRRLGVRSRLPQGRRRLCTDPGPRERLLDQLRRSLAV